MWNDNWPETKVRNLVGEEWETTAEIAKRTGHSPAILRQILVGAIDKRLVESKMCNVARTTRSGVRSVYKFRKKLD